MTCANRKLTRNPWDVRGVMDVAELGAFAGRSAAHRALSLWLRTRLRGIRCSKACGSRA